MARASSRIRTGASSCRRRATSHACSSPTSTSTSAATGSSSSRSSRRATPTPTLRSPMLADRPPIVRDYIPFGSRRKHEMRLYARRHYGIDDYHLRSPRVIVEHVTVTSSYSATYNTFAPDVPDAELHELPGTCSHFVVDAAGKIHQLVPLGLMCRHTVGLNWTAIGIEHVGTTDAQVMGDARQLRASLRLTCWLRSRYGIALRDV